MSATKMKANATEKGTSILFGLCNLCSVPGGSFADSNDDKRQMLDSTLVNTLSPQDKLDSSNDMLRVQAFVHSVLNEILISLNLLKNTKLLPWRLNHYLTTTKKILYIKKKYKLIY